TDKVLVAKGPEPRTALKVRERQRATPAQRGLDLEREHGSGAPAVVIHWRQHVALEFRAANMTLRTARFRRSPSRVQNSACRRTACSTLSLSCGERFAVKASRSASSMPAALAK